VWDHDLSDEALGVLMVFELNNKVYVIVAVGGSKTQSKLCAFTLDE
jgi:hypothetical protein